MGSFMMLIADSGSTKTHWKLIDGKHSRSVFTDGISPFYLDTEEIMEILNLELLPSIIPDNVSQVYFYGTGISQDDKKTIVQQALVQAFPKAQLEIEHDLLAAARSLCGYEPGIACILGTGSNSCLYNGTEIVDNIPSLGFLLGDEGSGGDIGRKLLRAYYYRTLPADLKAALEQTYDMDKARVLSNIYDAPKPNQETARYAAFVIDHKEHEFCANLLLTAFVEFFDTTVTKYQDYKTLPIHFVGSPAFLCSGILTELVEKMGLQMGNIVRDPMEGLVAYHQNKS